MRLKSLAVLAVAFALPAATFAAQVGAGGGGVPGYDVNKDLKNLGPAAYDVAIVLKGSETITNSMNGYPPGDPDRPGQFSSRTESIVGGNTVIHWEHMDDGTDNKIDNGQTIHVGFSTADGNREILDIYWTNASGQRIRGSVVLDVYGKVTYGSNRLAWDLANSYAEQATVSNIRYAILSSPETLPGLGVGNQALAAALHPIDGTFVLAGGESTTIEIPGDVAPGSAVVLVYEVSGEGSAAVVTNFVQTVLPAAAAPADTPGGV